MKELRIRLGVPPRAAVVVAPDEPLPPLALVKPTPRSEAPRPDPLQAEQARQLAADREFLQSTLARLEESIHRLHEDRHKQLADLQQLAIELAVVIGGRLWCREVAEDRFEIEDMVRDMARQMVDDEPVAVRLNPKDLHLMQRRLGSRHLFEDSDQSPKLVPDPAVDRGSCIVEGNRGSLAADPAAELMKLRDDLLERMTHARS